MANWKPGGDSEFRHFLPTLSSRDRQALVLLGTVAFFASFFALQPVLPTPLPLPPFVAVIDLNHADEATLIRLPGIGPALARRIVAYRNLHGPFSQLEALQRVKGIGPVLGEGLRPYVSLSLPD